MEAKSTSNPTPAPKLPRKLEGQNKWVQQIKVVFRKLWLIFMKNLLLRKRHYIITGFEIILPLFVVVLVVIINASIQKSFDNPPPRPVFPDSNGGKQQGPTVGEIKNITEFAVVNKSVKIGYLRQSDAVRDFVVDVLCPKLGISGDNAIAFENEEKMDAYVRTNEDNRYGGYTNQPPKLSFAVIIHGLMKKDNVSDYEAENNKISYTIRMPQQQSYDSDDPSVNEKCNTQYVDEYGTFVQLQVMIDKLLTEKLLSLENTPPTYTITTQTFPCPTPDDESGGIGGSNLLFVILPIFLVQAFVFIVPSIVRVIVSEKETGIKELLKMIGLPNWMHWVAWMLNSMIVQTITITLIVILLWIPFKIKGVIYNGDPLVWWIFFFVYMLWATTFCFLVSSLFERPTLATTVGILVWIVCFFAVPSIKWDSRTSLSVKLVACIFLPNLAFYRGVETLGQLQSSKHLGAYWTTIGHPFGIVETFTFAHCLLMLLISCVVNILLAMYLECVIPTKFGVRKPVYFIFMPSTWGIKAFGKKKETIKNASALRSETTEVERDSFETPPKDLPVGLDIIKLQKKFGNKVAVDDVTVKAYEGQIFCLLGHNGAGKTTTMSVLTGMMAPSSGTCFINQKDIRTEMDDIRQDLGLCPQHNMLFDKLTVAEHLKFFGKVKGLTNSQAKAEIPKLLQKLNLQDKTDVLAKSLSGGQKRRLSLGCAIIGNSKVLFLDECSSGLDPEVRRTIWNLLLEIREGRTIILTTHFLEEADVLGDRIAIMASGKVQCCGSPMFLKNYYGAGYTLTISLAQDGNPENVLQNVQRTFPGAVFKSRTKSGSVFEFVITIPTEENITSKFPAMFSSLLSQKSSLKILDVGIALTTMDEVFLKVDELSHSSNKGHSDGDTKGVISNAVGNTGPRVSGIMLVIQQFVGILLKKMLYCFRKWKLTLGQIILPVLLVILAVITVNISLSPNKKPPPLKMSLSSSFYNRDQVVLYSTDAENIGQKYAEVVGSFANKTEYNLTKELIDIGENDKSLYFKRYVVAAEIGPTSINAMHSSIYKHSRPLSVNFATNAMLRSLDTKNRGLRLEVTSDPLINRQEITDVGPIGSLNNSSSATTFGVLAFLGLGLLAASFIVLPIEERNCEAKQLQLMTGVNPLVYWISSFVWDYFQFLFCGLVIVILVYIVEDYERFTNHGGAGVLFLIIAVYGVGAVNLAYLLSLAAGTPAGGFSLIIILHILTGLPFGLTVFIIEPVSDPASKKATSVLGGIGCIFPSYGLAKSLLTYASLSIANGRCNPVTHAMHQRICENPSTGSNWGSGLVACCPNCGLDSCFALRPYINWKYKKPEPFSFGKNIEVEVDGIGRELVFMLIMSFIYFVLLMIIEFGLIGRLRSLICKSKVVFVTNSNDENVRDEAARVNNLVQTKTTNQDCFVVNNLCKAYGTFSAVSKLTFGVHYGECFGLLGVNGAGKTTSFKMLTGEEMVTDGNAWIENCTLQADRKTFLQKIGYCPQFDGIIGVLSGQQMLETFARLRGVKHSRTSNLAKNWLNRFGLLDSAHVQCQDYSGGMKRRLSAAMALIGDPPVIFMDEPTSGVDPASRRQFWSIMSSLKDSGGCIVLTSHSMDECENLCSRLGIMVNGELQCLGRVQHLKNKFAQGYSLTIKLKSTESATAAPSEVSVAPPTTGASNATAPSQFATVSSSYTAAQTEPSTVTISNASRAPTEPTMVTSAVSSMPSTGVTSTTSQAQEQVHSQLTALADEVIKQFHPCSFKEYHQSTIEFSIHSPDLPLDKVFETMEKIKKQFKSMIADYSVQQTTLEEVFLSFARKQLTDARKVKGKTCCGR